MSQTAKKRKSTRKKYNNKKKMDVKLIQREIITLFVFALSIFLFISNFGVGGKFGNVFSSVSFGIFGFMSYAFPIVIIVCVGLAASNGKSKRAMIKISSIVLLFLFLSVFCQLITKGYLSETTVSRMYHAAAVKKGGGGVIGGIICLLLIRFFGAIGAFLITAIGIIISMVILTEKSFVDGVTRGGKKVYSTAKTEQEKYKERAKVKQAARDEKREEREARRNKKVSGVALDTSLPKKANAIRSEDIHEITIDLGEENPKEMISPTDSNKEDSIYDFTPVLTKEEDPYENLTEKLERELYYNSESQPVSFDDFENNKAEINPLPKVDTEIKPTGNKEEVTKKNPVHTEKDFVPNMETVQKAEKRYQFPSLQLLKRGNNVAMEASDQHIKNTALKLEHTLQNFGVGVKVTNASCGPTVTRYELQPEQGVKVSKIVSLSDDIKLNLAASDIRIEAPIPGKAAIGIEVPNKTNSVVMLRDLLESNEFKKHPSPIAFAAGKDLGGQVVVTDIAKMPHLLIAGATGSGKSVCINTIIMSILYKAHPDDVKLIMIDPKVVELSVYNGIPHLFIPVVTDPKKASGALHWAVAEMTDRYKKFAELNVRDLKGYNEKIESIKDIEEEGKPEKLPQIVIIVDELADLMMVAPGEVEDAICRLAQLARAAGIHLIVATQRPSVNVITGLIKANMPSRIAFAVSSGVDSRTIIDMNGAEKLLGKGDMLFFPQGYAKPARVQGAFVSDKEVGDVVAFLTRQSEEITYNTDIEERMNQMEQATVEITSSATEYDVLFVEAGRCVIEADKASIGYFQRKFKVGFNRAARIMDQLAEAGVVGEEEGTKPRKVLMSMEEFEQLIESQV